MSMLTLNEIDVTHAVIVIGSVLGAIKANLSNKSRCVERIIDVFIGIFIGLTIGWYFQSENLLLSGVISLSSSMLGANVLDALLTMSPDKIRETLLKWLLKK